MTSSSKWPFSSNTILQGVHDELSSALSELQLTPEHLKRGDLQPKFAVDLLQDRKSMLPEMSIVQWAALKSVIHQVAEDGAGMLLLWPTVKRCYYCLR